MKVRDFQLNFCQSTQTHHSVEMSDPFLFENMLALEEEHHWVAKKKLECCELVVDPLAYSALVGLLFGATAFLNVAITMNITMRRRRRRKRSGGNSLAESLEGRKQRFPVCKCQLSEFAKNRCQSSVASQTPK